MSLDLFDSEIHASAVRSLGCLTTGRFRGWRLGPGSGGSGAAAGLAVKLSLYVEPRDAEAHQTLGFAQWSQRQGPGSRCPIPRVGQGTHLGPHMNSGSGVLKKQGPPRSPAQQGWDSKELFLRQVPKQGLRIEAEVASQLYHLGIW